jgi:hypothetical protein
LEVQQVAGQLEEVVVGVGHRDVDIFQPSSEDGRLLWGREGGTRNQWRGRHRHKSSLERVALGQITGEGATGIDSNRSNKLYSSPNYIPTNYVSQTNIFESFFYHLIEETYNQLVELDL